MKKILLILITLSFLIGGCHTLFVYDRPTGYVKYVYYPTVNAEYYHSYIWYNYYLHKHYYSHNYYYQPHTYPKKYTKPVTHKTRINKGVKIRNNNGTRTKIDRRR